MMPEQGEARIPTPEDQDQAFQAARRSSRSANVRNKQAALDACIEPHVRLIECFKENHSFSDCTELQKEFWACYKKERGILKSQIVAWLSTKTGRGNQSDNEAMVVDSLSDQ